MDTFGLQFAKISKDHVTANPLSLLLQLAQPETTPCPVTANFPSRMSSPQLSWLPSVYSILPALAIHTLRFPTHKNKSKSD